MGCTVNRRASKTLSLVREPSCEVSNVKNGETLVAALLSEGGSRRDFGTAVRAGSSAGGIGQTIAQDQHARANGVVQCDAD